MKSLSVSEDDLEEKFVRSSGAGGQNVNKVSTCVWLKHLPSGIIVKCQREREQAQNRFLARRLIVEKLEAKLFGEKSAAEQKKWKIIKQKKRRSRKAKEKILEQKKIQSAKKEGRKRPDVG